MMVKDLLAKLSIQLPIEEGENLMGSLLVNTLSFP